ncbi:hypothetical protein BJ742DRAFT_427133 [Cladochytrium replicatum]|nr:hypothetical protein BJ742DRAFT_427133 [Cladochytrium replicatum]
MSPSLASIKKSIATLDLSAKTALVVGGTSGIGLGISKVLAQRNANLIIAGRNESAVNDLKSSLSTNNENITFERVDMTLLADARRLGKKLVAAQQRLDYVVITAGMMRLGGRQNTSEGLDNKMAIHYYARLALLLELLPLILKTKHTYGDARVLSVFSAGFGRRPSKIDDLGLDTSYTITECANTMALYNDFMVQSLSEQHPEIPFTHAFPGGVQSQIQRGLPWYIRIPMNVLQPLITTEEDCGNYMLSGFLDDGRDKGWYLMGSSGQSFDAKGDALDNDLRKKVWEHSLKIVNAHV